jgi:hypothetical protein
MSYHTYISNKDKSQSAVDCGILLEGALEEDDFAISVFTCVESQL